MGFFNYVKGKYSKYRKEREEENKIYEETLRKEKLKYAEYKAKMKIQAVKTKAKEVAKAGGKFGYALKKIAEAEKKIKSRQKKSKNQRDYMNVFQ